jgi:hypothetical protein
VIYPSGRQVAYTLDTLGRIQQIATSKNNTPQTIADQRIKGARLGARLE